MFPAINNEKYFVLENWFGHRSSREKVEIKRFVKKSDEIGIIIWPWLSEAMSIWNRSWKNEIGKQFELSQLTESKQKKKKKKKKMEERIENWWNKMKQLYKSPTCVLITNIIICTLLPCAVIILFAYLSITYSTRKLIEKYFTIHRPNKTNQ